MGETSSSRSDTSIPRKSFGSLCSCHAPGPNLSPLPVLPHRILTLALADRETEAQRL